MYNFTEYLDKKKEQGLFNEFSEKHFLISAINGDMEYFQKSGFLFNNIADSLVTGIDYRTSFLINFNNRLKNMELIFKEDEINRFIRDQLSAGKEHYSQEQFFRAYSEINILNYLYQFARAYAKSVKAEYEPHIGINGANPEARFTLNDSIIIDVEVKTPGFSEKIDDNRNCIGVIRPNTYLSDNQFDQIREYTRINNIKFLSPDIVKLIGFIKDSIRKFQEPTHDKHYNLLFINWTYTELPIISYNEPISLLINNMSGILKNNLVKEIFGLTEEDLSKFSAIIVYYDNIESLITGDFRRLYLNNKFRIIINEKTKQDLDTLLRILQLKNHKEFVIGLYDDISINMLDYSFKHDINKEKINHFCKDIYDIMFSDLDLYKGLLGRDFSECELRKVMKLQKELVKKQCDIN